MTTTADPETARTPRHAARIAELDARVDDLLRLSSELGWAYFAQAPNGTPVCPRYRTISTGLTREIKRWQRARRWATGGRPGKEWWS